MSVIALGERANHSSHLRAHGLRGIAKQIGPFVGADLF
jgi:hypothetical protein